MTSKPTVELTFAGDEKKLVQAAERASRSVQQMGDKIETSGDSMAKALSADAAKAEKSLKELGNELKSLPDADVSVTADTAKAKGDIQSLKGEGGDTIKLPVEADTAKAKGDIKGLKGEKVKVPVEAETSGAKQALEGLGDLGTDVGDQFSGGLASNLKAGLAGAIAGVGATIAEGIASEISANNTIRRSLDLQFKLPPGLAQEYADLFDTGFFEGISDSLGGGTLDQGVKALEEAGRTAQDLAVTAANMKGTFADFGKQGPADVRALTIEMEKVAQMGGIDVTQAIKGADVAARNWGLSAWDATRLVGRGFDEMGLRGDDWAETLQEYPQYFKALGLSADDTFNLISQAIKGGARDTDYAADAIKEFGIRIIDGSATTVDALKSLGLNAAAIPKQIAAGGPVAREALDSIIDRLRNMQNPLERNRLGVALFGTQWEDTFKNVIGTTDLAVGATYRWGASVLNAAMAAKGQGDPALRQMIGSMSTAQLQAEGAAVRIDNLGRKVVTLPNGKEITVTAKDMASSTIQNIAGRSYNAVIKLTGEWKGFYGLPNGVVLSGSSARGNADGGWIHGAGTETSDSIPRMLSNNEFVTRASEATKPLNAMVLEAMNEGRDWQSLVAARPGIAPGVPFSTGGGGGGGGTVRVELAAAPGADGAVAQMITHLMRNNQIQIRAQWVRA
jgi:hypothetical protein